jgi:hypothetical protein
VTAKLGNEQRSSQFQIAEGAYSSRLGAPRLLLDGMGRPPRMGEEHFECWYLCWYSVIWLLENTNNYNILHDNCGSAPGTTTFLSA